MVQAPFDALRWVLARVGVNGYWPLVLFFIGSGALLFLLGTFEWLRARARKEGVATGWVYRISRHPQYLGWIIWSYGVYLLLLRGLYPKRSWGIGASLPWLLSTMVIIGVALVEELRMRRQQGAAYDDYRSSAPFLFPVPAAVGRILAAPFRWISGKDGPERVREVVTVLALYTVVLVGASWLTYGDGTDRIARLIRGDEYSLATMDGLARAIRTGDDRRARIRLADRLAWHGAAAVPHFVDLLGDDRDVVRQLAAVRLAELPASPAALAALTDALDDPVGDVRWKAAGALGTHPCPEAVPGLVRLLEDPEGYIRDAALQALAVLGMDSVVVTTVDRLLDGDDRWGRVVAIGTLGRLGSEAGLPMAIRALDDEYVQARREAAVTLLRIGSPRAIPALEQAARDEDWETRVYAAEAIKRLGAG